MPDKTPKEEAKRKGLRRRSESPAFHEAQAAREKALANSKLVEIAKKRLKGWKNS